MADDIHDNANEVKMQESLAAVRRPVLGVQPPRPIGNVAAGIAPGAVKAAGTKPVIVPDVFDSDVGVNFAFIGAGQGGARVAGEFYKLGYRRAAAFNTTDADFNGLPAGMARLSLDVGGAMKDTELARAATAARTEDVRDLMTRAWGSEFDAALVCASLGGGTGSGSAPELIRVARKYMEDIGRPPRVGAVVSLPTISEGFQVCRNAVTAFRRLVDLKISPILIIDNARIHQLYRPVMSALHHTANHTVASLLHLFNQLSGVRSPYMTFDRSEFIQLLDSGLLTMAASDIKKLDTPADISECIRTDLAANVLVAVDLTRGRKAACLFVGEQKLLDTFDLDYFEAGFTALDRILGAAYGAGDKAVQTVVHRGLYPGSDPGLQAYILVGELDIPRQRLAELAKKGGLDTGENSSIASFLGVD